MASPSTVRVGVLTTDTPHHRYFLRRLHREMPRQGRFALVLFEEKPYPWKRRARRHLSRYWHNPWRALARNPYLQPASLDREVKAFEVPRFFPDGDDSLSIECPIHKVYSVNDETSLRHLEAAAPDLLLVYGTGLVESKVFEKPNLGTFNAHGGKLPGYRGLDTNLWAAFEDKPEDMFATWHEVDATFDTGAVCLSERLEPQPELNLYSLRYFTALLCTDLCMRLLADRIAGAAVSQPQDTSLSRYYGPMPWLLKRRADRILRTYGSGGRT